MASSSSRLSRFLQEPTSEERFHVELHFSPGVKGCEDEENVPLGFGFRPASSEVRVRTRPRWPVPGLDLIWSQFIRSFVLLCFVSHQNKDKKPNQGSLEDLSQDQPDHALLLSEPISLLRRSPMTRNRKTGSMEVPTRLLRGPSGRYRRQRFFERETTACLLLFPPRSSLRPPSSPAKAARPTDSSTPARASRPRSKQPLV